MRRSIQFCLMLAILCGGSSMTVWAEEPSERHQSAPIGLSPLSWDDGLRLAWRSEWLSLRFGGKVMGDVGWVHGDGEENLGVIFEDQSQWRRLRPYISGTVANRLDFKLEGEFTGPGTQWMDLYLRFRDIPYVGKVTVGHFKEPFGLEQLTSSADTTFLERALPDAFAPGRSLGVMLQNPVFQERATWSLSVFRSLDDETCFPNGRGGEACAVTGRMTWLAWYDKQTDDLVHLGAAYSFRSLRGEARYHQRPEAHFVDNLSDTGSFRADRTHLLGTEAAWVRGPVSLQGEYMAACADRPTQTNAFLHGFYVQASYFLTGEHRAYDRKAGVFKSPRPLKPFPTKGLGAWEIGTRYSFLDLGASSLADTARQMQDLTVGLNWYLNPNVRMGWNYIRSWVDGSDTSDTADTFLMRLQVTF